MTRYDISINGSETLDALENDELKSLSLFYAAFNMRQMDLMKRSWLNADEISMKNPIGGVRLGWAEISEGYKRIFNGKAEVYVEFYNFFIHKTDAMFFATGRERGYFKTSEAKIELAIRTTRIFIKRENEWKQVHHHGSIDNPDLLKAYQSAVMNNS